MNKLFTTFGSVALIASLNVMLLLPTSAMEMRFYSHSVGKTQGGFKSVALQKRLASVRGDADLGAQFMLMNSLERLKVDSFIVKSGAIGYEPQVGVKEFVAHKGLSSKSLAGRLPHAKVGAVKPEGLAAFGPFDETKVMLEVKQADLKKLMDLHGSQGPNRPGVVVERSTVGIHMPGAWTF